MTPLEQSTNDKLRAVDDYKEHVHECIKELWMENGHHTEWYDALIALKKKVFREVPAERGNE